MNTAVTIIIAVIGSTGLSAFIQFLISRHDKKHDRLADIEKKLDKTEKDSVRMQLLFLINQMPSEHNEIMTLAEYYFGNLKGNWYLSSLFNKWVTQENLETPTWFTKEPK
jgi:hypothetical protein